MDLALKLFGGGGNKNKKEQEKKARNNNNVRPEDQKRPLSAHSSNEMNQGPCDFGQYVKVLEDFIFNTEKLGIKGLLEQYKNFCDKKDTTMTSDAFMANMYKNRYSDVHCRDSTRVVLKVDATKQGDYIHANYVRTPFLHNTFICTQGPIQTTIGDFWRMVFQERATSILMLCRPLEDGRPKCCVYWPEPDSELNVGGIKVTNIGESTDESNGFENINLLVAFDNIDCPETEQPDNLNPLSVTLIKWPNWPDRGVPDEKCHTVPQKLLAMVRHGPCVIHCSAGIGRTGCMVALEFAHRKLSMGYHVDFEKIALELRKQRAQCIQTEVQYLYIHRVMVAFAERENGISDKARQAACKFLEEYDKHMTR